MRSFLNSLFKSKSPRMVEDPALGLLSLRDKEWYFQRLVGGKSVEISIPDGGGLPCPEARRVWEVWSPSLEALWETAVDYTVEQIAPHNPRFVVHASHFELEGISAHAPAAFEGGELVFWFRITGDRDGSYFVPFHNGKPLLWHRDS